VLQRLTNEADVEGPLPRNFPTSAFFVGTNPNGELITSGLPVIHPRRLGLKKSIAGYVIALIDWPTSRALAS
jgi:hypothetical protein